jgi:putative membrane protein
MQNGYNENMSWILKLFLRTMAVAITAYLVPGVVVVDWVAAVVAAVVLGILNSILRPILLVLTIPINVMTLGLFTLVINTVVVLLAAELVPGFGVASFWTALLFSIVLSVVNWFLEKMGKG